MSRSVADINECDDPAVAARCVANAECCNLPAHFVCRCLPGFEGDGEEECRGKEGKGEACREFEISLLCGKTGN